MPSARALFDIDRSSPGFACLAEQTASPLARRWGLLAPPAIAKPESIRPLWWVREHNPLLVERLKRGGDLRCSIIESLRHDTPGRAATKSELSRLVAATKPATLKAIARLSDEGAVVVRQGPGSSHLVELAAAA